MTDPVIAPKAPNFGISKAFRQKFVKAPKITERVYYFVRPIGRRYCVPKTLLREINRMIGVVKMISGVTI